MMKGRIIFSATVFAFGVAAAAAAAPQKSAPRATIAPEQLMRNCDAHKFETVVEEIVDGQPHQSKVKLCGTEGQSDADWIGTLKDAVAKLQANDQMPAAVRSQIVTALNREIMVLSLRTAGGDSRKQAFNELPFSGLKGSSAKSQTSPELDIAQSYSPLPPVPGDETGTGTLPPPRQSVPVAPPADYAALPPLPTAPPPPVHVLASVAGASMPALPRPHMTLSCYSPGEDVGGPCTGFTRDTLLTVRADEDLPAGTSLRFVRDGDPKIDVALAQLKRGKSVRLAMPSDVCRHVVGGKLELRIVRAGQEVGTDGPYNLDC